MRRKVRTGTEVPFLKLSYSARARPLQEHSGGYILGPGYAFSLAVNIGRRTVMCIAADRGVIDHLAGVRVRLGPSILTQACAYPPDLKHSSTVFGRSFAFWVPELTHSADIKLNK